MISRFKKINKLQFVRVVYWLFLTYMVAAFIWWYVTLVKQNDQIANVQYGSIQSNDPFLAQKVNAIQDFQLRKNKQYIGEGLTILFLFLLGAIYVYRSLVKQIRYSNQQQNFMMAVTHELKTPIAITQLNIETLLKRNLDPDQQRKMLEISLLETQRLDNLCNNILLASQLDMGEYQANAQEVDLSLIVSNTLKIFVNRYSGRSFVESVQEGIFLKGESVLLQLLLNNLIDNAIKYSPSGSDIFVDLYEEANKIILSVKDQGVGVPVNDKDKIFEKFYRVGAEYTRSTKGTGLGLYLCKRIAMFHNAKLEVIPNAPKGSIFTFTYLVN
jgi:two-component system sensor histidine kinase CiaH